MITGPVYATFDDAYRAVLDQIRHRPQYAT